MKPHASKSRPGGRVASSQQVAFELKHRVILSLNKLADRDTNQIGVDELERIIDCLGPEGIGPFLSCIIETDSEQKSAVRKECVRIMGILSRSHGDLLGPHLGKMVGSIVKRLKDTDTVVRDACVEAVGVFASCVVKSGGDGGVGVPFDMLAKPLFEALGEQNRYVQAGAALCLAKVVDECSKPPVQILQPMLGRVIKFLKNPHFMAKAALIELVRSIVEAGGAFSEHAMSSAITSILEALKNVDWTTRKAASGALASISLNCQASLSSLKANCIQSLESCRFDKVKPVRDSVMYALQCWKSLPARDISTTSEISSSGKENYIVADSPDVFSISENGWRDNITRKLKPVSSINTKNQRSPLTMRKSSPKNQERCKPHDWLIELSLPKTHPSLQVIDPLHEESKDGCITRTSDPLRGTTMTSQGVEVEDYEKPDFSSTMITGCYESKRITIDHGCCTSEVDSFVNQQSMTDDIEMGGQVYSQSSGEQKSLDSTTMDFSPQTVCNCCVHASKELSLIRKQLSDFERKQSSLLDLLQTFMGNSVSNMSILQSKIHDLEYAIEKISQNVAESYRVIGSSKLGKKNQSVSSSPRFSTCTPQRSMDANYMQRSLISVRNSELWEDSASSKSQSVTSVKECSDTQRNPVSSKSGNSLSRSQKNPCRGLQGSGSSETKEVKKSSISGCIPRGKMITSEGNNSLWRRIKDFMYKEDIEAAYIEALCTGDELVLIELMDKSGPVLDKLSDKLVNEILCTLAGHILDQNFLGSIIPWLQQVVDLSSVNGPNYLRLSTKAKRELLLSIQEASSMNFCSPAERLSLSHLGIKLRHHWCEENPRCISNPRRNAGKHF